MDSTYPHLHERKQREEQKEATIRSIDETRDNVRRAIEEAKRETPRFAQTITDFHNETADATREITDTFLETQKNVVISIQDGCSLGIIFGGFLEEQWFPQQPWPTCMQEC
jgi:septal ring factor EnvC (AmiA/AmiB activator)